MSTFMDMWGDDDDEDDQYSTGQANSHSGAAGAGNPFGNPGSGNPFSSASVSGSGNPFGKSSNSLESHGRGLQQPQQRDQPPLMKDLSVGVEDEEERKYTEAVRQKQMHQNQQASREQRAYLQQQQKKRIQHQQMKELQKKPSQWIRDSTGEPLLSLRAMDGWMVGGSAKIRVVAAAHRTLVIATEDEKILWWDTSRSVGPSSFDVSSKGGRNIESIFLDPTGNHLLISMATGDNYYLHSSFDRVRSLKKMSGVHIQSIAWDKHGGGENATQTILVGGRAGDIYEAQLDHRRKDKYWKQVYQLDDEVPICGLEYESFPSSGKSDDSNRRKDDDAIGGDTGDVTDGASGGSVDRAKYFVMAVTAQPTRYYQFVGGPTFEHLFSKFGSGGKMPARFNEFGTELPYSELHFFSKNYAMRAESFAMLTEVGILHGQLMFGSQNAGDSVVKDTKLLDYSRKGSDHKSRTISKPSSNTSDDSTDLNGQKFSSPSERGALLSMTITEFHFLLLYQHRLCAFTRITHEVVFEQNLIPSVHGRAKGLVRDPVRNQLWLYSRTGLFQVQIDREDRDVWRLYLQQAKAGDGREFEFAFQHAKSQEQQNLVRAMQADHYFSRKEYVVAARYYAKTKRSFEEVVLKFVTDSSQENASKSKSTDQTKLRKALKTYLLEKLKNLAANDKTQKTILCMWLVEMYLNEMNDLGINGGSSIDESDPVASDLILEFKSFLKVNCDHVCGLNRECAETTYQLISAHGQMGMLLYFAELIQDYERMMTHYIQEDSYEEAVELLRRVGVYHMQRKKSPPPEAIIELFYKFSPVLMEHAPKVTVKAWIIMKGYLDPSRLIPALVRYSQQLQSKARDRNAKREKERQLRHAQQRLNGGKNLDSSSSDIVDATQSDVETSYAIQYLDHCVHRLRNTHPAIHNFLLWLYAQQEDDGKSVLDFVCERSKPYFDLDYALRVCMQANQLKACVRIYTMMNLFDEAVTLALQIGEIDLAKEHATRAASEEAQKKLWLKIAKQIIEDITHRDYRDGDIKEAIKILKDSDDLLKIEDILPLFPDFTTIDDFKTEICDALEEYNENLHGLKDEMNAYVESAKDIRRDIKKLRSRRVVITNRDKCQICGERVTGTNFYAFPDQRVYHCECLVDWVLPHLQPVEAQQVRTIRQQIDHLSRSAQNSTTVKEQEQLRLQLDDIVASGWLIDHIMIDHIDKPFVDDAGAEIGVNPGGGGWEV